MNTRTQPYAFGERLKAGRLRYAPWDDKHCWCRVSLHGDGCKVELVPFGQTQSLKCGPHNQEYVCWWDDREAFLNAPGLAQVGAVTEPCVLILDGNGEQVKG